MGATTAARLYYVTMDETKRANRLWRHVVGDAGADDAALRGGGRAVRHRRRQDPRRALPGRASSSKDTTEWRVVDGRRAPASAALRIVFAAPRRHRVRPRAPRRPLLRPHQRHRPQLPPGHGRRGERPTWRSAEELIAARDRRHARRRRRLRRPPRRHRARRRQPAAARARPGRAASTRSPSTSPRTASTPAATPSSRRRTLRFVYTSMTTPASTYDYDAGEPRARAEEAPAGARLRPVAVRERAHHGAAPPTAPRCRSRSSGGSDRKRAGPQPLLLYGYGSYGIPIDPAFSQTRVSLLDRGVVFAIAHIRGGGDLGRSWYEAGKMATRRPPSATSSPAPKR